MRYHLNKITRILQAFLIAHVLFFLGLLWINLVQVYSFMTEHSIRHIWDDSPYTNIQMAQAFVGFPLFIIFVVWIYRATFNTQLAFGRQSISPGWAAGWNFIPVANFFMVYRAMANLWFHFSHKSSRYDFLLLWWLTYAVITCVDIFWEISISQMDVSQQGIFLFTITKIFILVGYIITNIMEIRVVNVITRGEAQTGHTVAGVFS